MGRPRPRRSHVQQSLGDKSFKKGQTLSYINGYAREEPQKVVQDVTSTLQSRIEATEARLAGLTGSPGATARFDSPSKLPQWVENDRKVRPGGAGRGAAGPGSPLQQHDPVWPPPLPATLKVLRFFGYFKESIVESNIENHRIRKVILYYYLEDDSMHVAEPRQDNSGIPQVQQRALGRGRGRLQSGTCVWARMGRGAALSACHGTMGARGR
jgi:hypothetical protein